MEQEPTDGTDKLTALQKARHVYLGATRFLESFQGALPLQTAPGKPSASVRRAHPAAAERVRGMRAARRSEGAGQRTTERKAAAGAGSGLTKEAAWRRPPNAGTGTRTPPTPGSPLLAVRWSLTGLTARAVRGADTEELLLPAAPAGQERSGSSGTWPLLVKQLLQGQNRLL